MNKPTAHSGPAFEFFVNQDGVFHIQSQGQFGPELSSDIIRQIRDSIDEAGTPVGILLDMRQSDNLSIVRLSHLIDLLTECRIPVAVLLGTDTHLQLAVLLHNTLNNHAQVAYFTERVQARAYLLKGKVPHSSNTPH